MAKHSGSGPRANSLHIEVPKRKPPDVIPLLNKDGGLAGYAKVLKTPPKEYDVRHNISAQIAGIKNEKDAQQMLSDLNKAIASHQLNPSRGTVRKWGKQLSNRIRALRRAKLYDAGGNPVI